MKLLKRIFHALAVAALLGLFVRTFIFQAYRIPTSSMEPGLEVGDQVVVNKIIFAPHRWDWEKRYLPIREVRRNDITVFRYPEDLRVFFIKRVVGIENDRVEMVDKQLFINGKLQNEPWVVHRDERIYPRADLLDETFRLRDQMSESMVPKRELWCLGDNRDNSLDSRYWDSLPIHHVVGRPVLIYSSFDQSESVERVIPRWNRWFRFVR